MIQGVGAVREVLLILVRRGRNDQVVSEGFRNIGQVGQSAGSVTDERTSVKVNNRFNVVNGVNTAIGEAIATDICKKNSLQIFWPKFT